MLHLHADRFGWVRGIDTPKDWPTTPDSRAVFPGTRLSVRRLRSRSVMGRRKVNQLMGLGENPDVGIELTDLLKARLVLQGLLGRGSLDVPGGYAHQ